MDRTGGISRPCWCPLVLAGSGAGKSRRPEGRQRPVMLAVLLALASAVGYGSSDYAGGMAARRASLIRVTILA